MASPARSRPVPAPSRGRSPDTVIQVIQLDAKFFAVFDQLLHWMRAISPQALMSLVWVETLYPWWRRFCPADVPGDRGRADIERLR